MNENFKRKRERIISVSPSGRIRFVIIFLIFIFAVCGCESKKGAAKIGVYRNGVWYVDSNGNGVWNGCGTTPDKDRCYTLGQAGDVPVVGDWDDSGMNKIGVYRNGTWYVDSNGNGVWDGCGMTPDKDRCYTLGQTGDVPVVGDWNKSGASKIGVYRNGVWYVDSNGNGVWDGCGTTPDKDRCYTLGQAGDVPVVGDWDGSGASKIGVYRNGVWYVDYNGNGVWDGCGTTPEKDRCYSFGMSMDKPLAGVW